MLFKLNKNQEVFAGLNGNILAQMRNITCHFLSALLQAVGVFHTRRNNFTHGLQKMY